MKRASDSFVFTPELGAKLRELRQRAGLSQGQLMVLAGRRCKGAATLVSRLERGQIRYPSFGIIVDYLRACRADFRELGDLLTGYTSQPVALERRPREEVEQVTAKLPDDIKDRVLSCPTRLALVGEGDGLKPPVSESPERKAERVARMAWALEAGKTVEEAMAISVELRGWHLSPKQMRWLTGVCRNLMRLIVRWPGYPGRVRRRFRRGKDRAVARAGVYALSPAQVEALAEEVWDVHGKLGCGVLDRCRAIRELSRPGHGEYRRSVARERQLDFERACNFAWAETSMAAYGVFAGKISDQNTLACLQGVITELSTLAMDRSATDEDKRASIAAYAARSRYAEMVRDAGEAALAKWQQMKSTIPPQPQPGDAVPAALPDDDDRLFKALEKEWVAAG